MPAALVRRAAALLALLTTAAAPGARADDPAAPQAATGAAAPLAVYAAASLTDVLPAIDRTPAYAFGGTNTLAQQIRSGAPADVIASANAEIPELLYRQGYVDEPMAFTRNVLVVVVPDGNPAGIRSVYDLAQPGARLAVAAPAVPAGAYTLQVLRQLGVSATVLSNIVTQEPDVRNVLARVALGQADAGFVYATDARTAPDAVDVVRVPAWAQPKVTYSVAVVAKSPNRAAARAFVARLLGARAQTVLARHGFLPLPAAQAPLGRTTVRAVTTEVRRGGRASLTVAVPGPSRCAIAVVDAAGRKVVQPGLVAKGPGAGGTVTWGWVVGRSAPLGRATVRVGCSSADPGLRMSIRVVG